MTANTITTLGSRTVISGGASGLDTAALATAAYNQRKLPSDSLLTKISNNTKKTASYSQLQSLAQAVQTSLSAMKKNYSILNTSSSVFDSRAGTLSSSSSTPANNLVDVTINPGTSLGSYEIEVQDKAQAHKVGGNTATTDKTVALGYTGTFDITVAGGTASTINVTSGMSLSDLATAINAQKTTTGVGAAVVKTSNTGYQLVLSADATNKQISVTNITGNDVLQNLGVLDSGGAFANPIQTAQGATITLDGVPITRDSNDFSDLIDGVNLTVKNAEIGTKIGLKIENDVTSVETGVQAFIDAYNTFRDFVTTNQTVVNNVASEDALLFGDFTMKSLSKDIQGLLAGNFGSSSATIRNLRDVGITIDADNHLQLDETKFEKAATSNYSEVVALFQTSAISDNSNFKMSANTSNTQSLSAAIDITYSGGAITNVSVGGDNTLFDITGATIKGKTGTVYEGMTFAYVGTTSTTVNFSIEQGLSDLLNNRIDTYSNVVSGSIQSLKTGLDKQNTDMQSRSDRILERASDFRDRLLEKYAGYEAKIAASKTILAQIQAILNAKSNN